MVEGNGLGKVESMSQEMVECTNQETSEGACDLHNLS
jgi:hypothetical protein